MHSHELVDDDVNGASHLAIACFLIIFNIFYLHGSDLILVVRQYIIAQIVTDQFFGDVFVICQDRLAQKFGILRVICWT